MWFGALPSADAVGCILAHSVKLPQRRVKKGVIIDRALADELLTNAINEVVVARLDATDLHEDAAAMHIALRLSAGGIVVDKPNTGRVNLFAEHDGLLCFDRAEIIAANSIDESITVATLPENSWVVAGRMVATCKIITYGVGDSSVQAVTDAITAGISVAPVIEHRACLIQTRLLSLKASVLDKTSQVITERLQARDAHLVEEHRCEHTFDALCAQLTQLLPLKCDWLLIAGASAISDRADVIPAAIEAVGGQVYRYGLPVDPGNLLLFGELQGCVVLGLPGCARSPKHNGLDLLLDRLACKLEIDNNWLNTLAVGGLLTEMVDRPQPRISVAGDKQINIGGLVLAAGSSRRAGVLNKLAVKVGPVPMVRAVVDTVCASELTNVVVVTGHQHEKIERALHGMPVEFEYCAQHAQGMAHSLSRGISRLSQSDAVLVFLADMPGISVDLINRMLSWREADVSQAIVVPVFNGQRGNPVMVGRTFFDSLLQHSGDSGARFLMKQYPDKVFEIPVDDPAVLLDYDTPQALQELGGHVDE